MGLVRGAQVMMESWEWAWLLRREGKSLVWVRPPILYSQGSNRLSWGVATVPAGSGLHSSPPRDGPSGPSNAGPGEVEASAQTPTLPCRGRVLRESTNPDVEKAGSSIHLKPLGHTLCLCASVSSS